MLSRCAPTVRSDMPSATLAAQKAAMAAEATGGQGQFWPMHDLLYEHQDALDERSLATSPGWISSR